ncbi:glycosyltransferase family A protein [Yunchengibacter salinarum]|uniref:glycosyltransferase family A protein n=1 Tax=Yunchengibacter salinarum TaxID=3133399 RepID=UPI0035B6671F
MRDFAVIIPTRNRADLLAETVASVLAQSLPPAEVVVVDDGSDDHTVARMAAFAPRVRLVRRAGGGGALARRAEIPRTESPWIAFQDDDDIWQPNHLAALDRALAFAEAAGTPAGLAFANFDHIGPAAKLDHDHFAAAPKGWWARATALEDGPHRLLRAEAYLDFLRYNPVFPSAMAFSRTAYEAAGGIDPAFNRTPSGDSDLTRRLTLVTRAVCTCERTVHIRKHGGNFSRSSAHNTLGRARILESHVAGALVPRAWRAQVAGAARDARAQAVSELLWAGDVAGARAAAAGLPAGLLRWQDRIKLLAARLTGRG